MLPFRDQQGWTRVRHLWREYRPRFTVQLPKREPVLEPVLEVSISRFSLGVGYLTTPGVEWNAPGYDGLWTSWGVFPLFDFEAQNKKTWWDYERKPL